jgi:hypothetical protein
MEPQPAFVERRTIEFSARGVLQVVHTSLRGAAAFGLPTMPPDDVRLLQQAGKVAFRYGSGETAQWVSIGAEQLGALLLAYCVRTKVPLPRRGDKEVLIKSHSVLLTFQVQHAEATAPEVPEPRTLRPAAAVRAWSWRSAETSAYGGAIEDLPKVWGAPEGRRSGSCSSGAG